MIPQKHQDLYKKSNDSVFLVILAPFQSQKSSLSARESNHYDKLKTFIQRGFDGISEAVVYEHPIAESFRGSIIVPSVITRFANRRWWVHTKKFTLDIIYWYFPCIGIVFYSFD
mgnify:CR=1 FL=1